MQDERYEKLGHLMLKLHTLTLSTILSFPFENVILFNIYTTYFIVWFYLTKINFSWKDKKTPHKLYFKR